MNRNNAPAVHMLFELSPETLDTKELTQTINKLFLRERTTVPLQ